jgi:hypothetical protein
MSTPGRVRPEDTFDYQIERLRKLVAEKAPGKEFIYDETRSLIHFRIVDPITGTELAPPAGEWHPSELADKSDGELWAMIQGFSNGKL